MAAGTPSLIDQLTAARKDADYQKREAQKAFKDRDEVKKSLEAIGGPAVFWREQAKEVAAKYAASLTQVGSLRQAEHAQRMKAIEFSEQVDQLKDRLERHRLELWELWTALAEDNPVKQQLWSIWAALA